MDSGGSPENCPKIVNISKIYDFGGSPKNPREIVLGSFEIVKNSQNLAFWTTWIFDHNIVAASGRCQKRGGGLWPPPLFWTILLAKNSISGAPKTIFWWFLTIFEAPEDDFSRIFRGSSEIVDFGFFCFYDFWQFSGDPAEFIKFVFFFTIFGQSGIL